MSHQPTPLLAVVLLALTGCRGGQGAPLPEDPDELTLFSIDGPTWWKRDGDVPPGERGNGLLLGYPVLGSVEVADPDQRRAVAAAINGAAAYHPKGATTCFIPRHAVRSAKGGQVVRLVVCFQCENFHTYRGDRREPGRAISGDAQPLLDKLLTDAGVPLAPKELH